MFDMKTIWHRPSETTDVDNNLIIDDWTNRTYELGYFDGNDMVFRNLRNDDTYFEESMMCWCDVNELIDDYYRTRKALGIAIDVLKLVRKYLCEMPDPSGATIFRMACESATTVKNALDEIKTVLEQK